MAWIYHEQTPFRWNPISPRTNFIYIFIKMNSLKMHICYYKHRITSQSHCNYFWTANVFMWHSHQRPKNSVRLHVEFWMSFYDLYTVRSPIWPISSFRCHNHKVKHLSESPGQVKLLLWSPLFLIKINWISQLRVCRDWQD